MERMGTKFLEELRSKTHSIHRLIEQTEISKAIISPGVTLVQYEQYLQKVLCLHRAVEETIHPLLSTYIPDLAERQKSEKILSDLKELHFQPKNYPISFLDAEFIPSIGFCFGILYVVEGSTLGGMYILKNMIASVGKDNQIPTKFLTAYGQHTGSKWKMFLETLNEYVNSRNADEAEEVIKGATYGFNQVYKLFKA